MSVSLLMCRQSFTFTAGSEIVVEMRQWFLQRVCIYWKRFVRCGRKQLLRKASRLGGKRQNKYLPIHMVWYFNESGRQRKGQNKNFNVAILLFSDKLQSQIHSQNFNTCRKGWFTGGPNKRRASLSDWATTHDHFKLLRLTYNLTPRHISLPQQSPIVTPD